MIAGGSPTTMDAVPSETSSEASYFEQEPISGAVLLDQELLHREECEAKGNVLTGCYELDAYVLLGGLPRGGVVGLSAEEETFGLLVRHQRGLFVYLLVWASNIYIARTSDHCQASDPGRWSRWRFTPSHCHDHHHSIPF